MQAQIPRRLLQSDDKEIAYDIPISHRNSVRIHLYCIGLQDSEKGSSRHRYLQE